MAGKRAPAATGPQTTFLSRLETPVAVDPHVVLLGDPRWDDCLAELGRAPWHAIDTEWWHDTPPSKKGGRQRVDPWCVTIRLVQISLPSGRVLVADLGGVQDDRAARRATYARFLEVLGAALASRERLTIAHNLKGDALLLRIAFGFRVRAARCSMLLSQIYWAGVRGYRHSLAAVLRRMGRSVEKRLQQSDWRGPLSDSQVNYAARDPLEAVAAYKWIGARVKAEGMLRSAEAEMGALPAFVECEYHGLPVDEVMLDDQIAVWRRLRRDVIRPFTERYPNVEPTKGEKVAVALTRDRCYGGHRFYTEGAPTKTGKRKVVPKVGEEVLIKWDNLPWINALMEQRSIAVMDVYLSKIRARLRGGRVRGEYAQIAGGESRGGEDKTGKGQGRSSCAEPNLQNSPKLQPAHKKMGGKPPREPFRPRSDRDVVIEPGKSPRYLERGEDPPAGARVVASTAKRYDLAADALEAAASATQTTVQAQWSWSTSGSAQLVEPSEADAESSRLLARARYLREAAADCRRRPRAMIVADLSQAHARIATQASQDATLLRAYRDGLDVHCITASALARLRGLDWAPDHIAKIRKKDTEDGRLAASLRDMSKPVFYGCVPDDAQALTRFGWRTRDRLHVGDEILAYNPATGYNEWTPIRALNVYDDAPVYEVSFGAKWRAHATADHRWIGDLRRRSGVTEEFTTTATMPRQFRVRVSAPAEGGPGIDGEHVEAQKYDFDWVAYVLRLTATERRAFLMGCLVSEGHVTKPSPKQGRPAWILTQKGGPLAEAMLLAAYLEGYKVSVNNDDGKHGPVWRMRLCRKEVVTGQKLRRTSVGRMRVWCPTTDFGTWVMRQGNVVTITGNSLNLQGPPTLQRTAATSPEPVPMTLEEATQGRDAWRTAYAGLYAYQRRTIRRVNATDVVIDGNHYGVGECLTGRRMFFLKTPDKYDESTPTLCAACGKVHGQLSVKGPDVVASVWMRTEADIIKRAMGLILDAFDARPEWEAVLCNMAHDEVDVECAEEHADAVAEEIQRIVHACMRWGGIVDLPVDDLGAKAANMIVVCWADK